MSQLPEKTFGNSWLGSIQDHKDHPGSIQAIRIGPDVEVEEVIGCLRGLKICLQGLAPASSCLGYILYMGIILHSYMWMITNHL